MLLLCSQNALLQEVHPLIELISLISHTTLLLSPCIFHARGVVVYSAVRYIVVLLVVLYYISLDCTL